MSSLKTTEILFFTLFFISLYDDAFAKQKVCIIGAGRAGLATTKTVAAQLDKFELITSERNSDVGGLWIYRDDPEVDENGLPAHSGIYKSLTTLTTKQTMMYPDYEFNSDDDDGHGHVSHETFLKYMRDYADHFKLREHIRLNTLVTKVRPLNDNCTSGKIRWIVRNTNLKTQKNDTTICDAVVVCNGHYSKPNIPKITGMETFKGKKLHSRSYRIPQNFTNKTVIILGAQASGRAIARDLGPYAKTIYLSRRLIPGLKPNAVLEGYSENVIIVDAVVEAEGNRFTLKDHTNVTADAFIFCTGYVYNFPFLRKNSGIKIKKGLLLGLQPNGFINTKYSSMSLIGFGVEDISTGLYYSEMESFLKSLTEEKRC